MLIINRTIVFSKLYKRINLNVSLPKELFVDTNLISFAREFA